MAENPPQSLFQGLMDYGPLAIIVAVLLWKDYKNEQFLQNLVNDLKKSIDAMSDKIDKKIK